MTDKPIPKCQCGAYCWAHESDDEFTPCEGSISVSEDYPGEYLHFCDHHGHLDDFNFTEGKSNV